ncbi:MAG: hypothetical protein HYZ42_16725, partial [Bacteroidetes bacterium]|nr:hypothetical protein [Bacteroidota bacterium]
ARGITSLENGSAIDTDSGTISSTIVVNSSGRKSNFEATEGNAEIKGTNYIGVKYHLRLKRDPSQIEIHNFDGGYCGISNIEGNKSCLCYIVNARQLRASANSIRTMEKEVLCKNTRLKFIFENAEFLYQEPLVISGINFRIKKTVSNDVFYLGDAAGSIAPITGNGMSIALSSAHSLAALMDDFFKEKINLKQLKAQYKTYWSKEFSLRIKLSRYFQRLSEIPLLTRGTIGLFKAFPFLAKAVIKLTHGKEF